MNQEDYFKMSIMGLQQYSAQQYQIGQQNQLSNFTGINQRSMLDINASIETAYPVKNSNSMNKKLEAAKKWLKDRKASK